MKAGLAKRLADHDPARAAIEIGEVEELARRSLADVRAAVSNYRIVTLATELATAQEVLRAAGIDARVLAPTDTVDADLQELFGWVVREATTNVVRHAARHGMHDHARPPVDRDQRQRPRRRATAGARATASTACASGSIRSAGRSRPARLRGGGWRVAVSVP